MDVVALKTRKMRGQAFVVFSVSVPCLSFHFNNNSLLVNVRHLFDPPLTVLHLQDGMRAACMVRKVWYLRAQDSCERTDMHSNAPSTVYLP